MKAKEIYIVNGRKFSDFESALTYCESKNFRITKTETIRKGVYLITVSSN